MTVSNGSRNLSLMDSDMFVDFYHQYSFETTDTQTAQKKYDHGAVPGTFSISIRNKK